MSNINLPLTSTASDLRAKQIAETYKLTDAINKDPGISKETRVEIAKSTGLKYVYTRPELIRACMFTLGGAIAIYGLATNETLKTKTLQTIQLGQGLVTDGKALIYAAPGQSLQFLKNSKCFFNDKILSKITNPLLLNTKDLIVEKCGSLLLIVAEKANSTCINKLQINPTEVISDTKGFIKNFGASTSSAVSSVVKNIASKSREISAQIASAGEAGVNAAILAKDNPILSGGAIIGTGLVSKYTPPLVAKTTNGITECLTETAPIVAKVGAQGIAKATKIGFNTTLAVGSGIGKVTKIGLKTTKLTAIGAYRTVATAAKIGYVTLRGIGRVVYKIDKALGGNSAPQQINTPTITPVTQKDANTSETLKKIHSGLLEDMNPGKAKTTEFALSAAPELPQLPSN